MSNKKKVYFHRETTEIEISESLFVAPEPFTTEVRNGAMATF